MSFLKRRRRDYHGVHVDPARVKKQKRATKFRKFLNTVYAIIIFGTLLWLVYFVLYSSTFKIKNITITGNQGVSREEIVSVVNVLLDSKKYFIVPKNTFFTVNTDGLSEVLNDNFILAYSEIKKKFPHDLNISIREKLAGLNFCLETREKCYYVNYDGLVVHRVGGAELDPRLPLLFYRLSPQKNEQVGETPTPATTTTPINKQGLPTITISQTNLPVTMIRFVLELFIGFSQKIRETGIHDMEVNTLEIYEKKVIVNTHAGYQIYFNYDKSLAEQMNNLNTILMKKIKGEQENLEYVDLRFGEKIYYKMK
ncbi:FtsQ-type POTRA domain-containing protein [Patescibacteria group bacterium]|nr:FtsQ-type POTRA domain-containing protein [Patescibacteria group bacterium]MBU4512954.1 FtsQ-type POTRA domain-containing protein [Patescibacteria group bacterium]MCG2692990.1 FtsQ-type POTRA domain-containing protein [Candidatus Parcubacteria bacterium]